MSDLIERLHVIASRFGLTGVPISPTVTVMIDATCKEAADEILALNARIKEPLTDEGWMRACLEAREERDRLRALSESRRAMLVSVEWNVPATAPVQSQFMRCQVCQGIKRDGHKPDCALAKAIADA